MVTLANKKSKTTIKSEIQISREELLKKMVEEFSKLNTENLGKQSIPKRRKPLKSIEIGKIYSFAYKKGPVLNKI